MITRLWIGHTRDNGTTLQVYDEQWFVAMRNREREERRERERRRGR